MKKIAIAMILLIVGIKSSFGIENSKCDWLDKPKHLEGYTLISGSDEFRLVDDDFFVQEKINFDNDEAEIIAFDLSIILTSQENQKKMTEWLIKNREKKLKSNLKIPYKGAISIYKDNELIEKVCFESKDKKFIRKRYETGKDQILIYNKTGMVDNFSNTKEYGSISDNEKFFLLDDLVVFSSQYDIEKIKNITIFPYIYIDNSLKGFQPGYYFDAKISKAKSSPKFLSNEPDFLLYGSKTYDSKLFERSKPKY